MQADTATSYGTSTIHFLDVVVDPVPNRVPRVAICFDDGTVSDYDEAFSYMNPKGVPGTSFLQYDKVNDPADSGRTSLTQVKKWRTRAGGVMAIILFQTAALMLICLTQLLSRE